MERLPCSASSEAASSLPAEQWDVRSKKWPYFRIGHDMPKSKACHPLFPQM